MAFDGIFLSAVTKQLNNTILKGRVNKLYVFSKYEMLMHIRSFNKNYKLLVSIHPNYARVQLSALDYPTSNTPSSLTMLYRKYLEGAYIESIEQINLDRILHITFIGTNEVRDTVKYHLYIEIMGKHSNCILTHDNHKIIDCIKRVPPANNTVRYLTPGATYILPPLIDKHNPFNEEVETDDYVNTYMGFSKDLSNEVEYRIKSGESFNSIMDEIKESQTFYLTRFNNKEYYHCIELKHLLSNTITYDLTDGLDTYYDVIDQKDRIKQQTQDLSHYIQNEYKKNVTKLNKLEKTLFDSENSDDYRIKGDLLFASLDLVHKGDTKVVVDNYYDNTKMTIDLDPKLDGKENAKKYYNKYNKAKNSIQYLNEQIQLTKDEIEYFDSLNTQMSLANYYDALEIKEELENLGYLRIKNKQHHPKQKKKKITLTTFKPRDDLIIYVGKNNIQNEYLTFKFASKEDTFFHVKDMPGSHVIVKTEHLDEFAIRYAANVAAYYSKGKASSSVPVNYAAVKTLKRPTNSKLGKVILSNYKTIYIDPEDSFLKDEVK